MTKKHTYVGYTEKVGSVDRSIAKPEVLYWGEGVGVRIGLFQDLPGLRGRYIRV